MRVIYKLLPAIPAFLPAYLHRLINFSIYLCVLILSLIQNMMSKRCTEAPLIIQFLVVLPTFCMRYGNKFTHWAHLDE